MKIKVTEIAWGICIDENGNCYVGVNSCVCKDVNTGKTYQISKRDENKRVAEIEA